MKSMHTSRPILIGTFAAGRLLSILCLLSILMCGRGWAQDNSEQNLALESVSASEPDPASEIAEPVAPPSLAESEQILLPQFDLPDNATLDQSIRQLLKNNVTVFNRPADKISSAELKLVRSAVSRQITGLLATEGYFSPVIKFTNEFENKLDNPLDTSTNESVLVQKVNVHINVELGPPTKVKHVQLSFVGDVVPLELQQSLQASWALPKEAQFRDDDWTQAKANVLESLMEQGYAAAKVDTSEAIIQDNQADIAVSIDSGPLFYVGELRIKGLHLYGSYLLERYHPPKKGDIYSEASLILLQRALQNSPYFSSVGVSIDPDPDMAHAVPIDVLVQERKEHDIGLAAGYSTNTRMRGELSFQDRNFIGNGYNLKSALRIEQLRQIGYADIFLPPKPSGYLDSVGVLFKRSDIEGLITRTSLFGAKRVITENAVEKRLGLSFIYEQSNVIDGEKKYTTALVPSIGRTWRTIDNTFNPRDGQITQLDISGAAKVALSDQNFVRLYGKHQRWIPINVADVLILRAEGGYVLAPDYAGIPEDLLFRAGGTGSVRGYAYQSLGVNRASGVAGGRFLTTLSAEYVHWLKGNWGVAGFIDVGDAADRFVDLKMKQGIGIGARYKTLAGPLAFDIAYGRQAKKVRFDFFIGIAF